MPTTDDANQGSSWGGDHSEDATQIAHSSRDEERSQPVTADASDVTQATQAAAREDAAGSSSEHTQAIDRDATQVAPVQRPSQAPTWGESPSTTGAAAESQAYPSAPVAGYGQYGQPPGQGTGSTPYASGRPDGSSSSGAPQGYQPMGGQRSQQAAWPQGAGHGQDGSSAQGYPPAPQGQYGQAAYGAPQRGGYPSNVPTQQSQYGSAPQGPGQQGGYSAQQGPDGSSSPSGAQQYGSTPAPAPQGPYGSSSQNGVQQNGSAQAGQYGSAPQGYPSAPQGQYGSAGSDRAQQSGYSSNAPTQQSPYGSTPQAQPQQSGYPSAQQGQSGVALQGYPSAPQGQYGAAPQGSQYGSTPQGGQYDSGQPGFTAYRSHSQQSAPASQNLSHQPGTSGWSPSGAAPASATATETTAPKPSPVAAYGPFVPALLGLIAPFVAWLTFAAGTESVALNGIGGNSNSANADLGASKNTAGIFVLILALGLIATGVLALLRKLDAKVAGIVSAVIGLVLLVIGVLQFPSASSAVSADGPASGYTATIGAGVWLTILSGVLALAVGIISFLQARRSTAKPDEAAAQPSQQASQTPWGLQH